MLLSYTCHRYASNPFQDTSTSRDASSTTPSSDFARALASSEADSRTTPTSTSTTSASASSPPSELFPGSDRIVSSLSAASASVSSSFSAVRDWAASGSSPASESTTSPSQPSSGSPTSSWRRRCHSAFFSSSDKTPTDQTEPERRPPTWRHSSRFHPSSSTELQQDQPEPRRTTFTFVLFGATSIAALAYLSRKRRVMNRLTSAKHLAYRDARAWRKVALDLAKINALAASRVQNVVAGALSSGQDGREIARQIENELQEARRSVADRRAAMRRAEEEEAASGTPFASNSLFDAWSDFFGSSSKPSRYDAFHCSHKHGGEPGMSDGVSLRSSGRWSRSKVEPTTLSSVHRSPQEKWQRVAGMAAAQESAESSPGRTDPTSTIANNPAEANATAAAAATPPTTTRSASRLGMAASSLRQSQGLEQHEEWIGDVNRAILERDLKSSQEARRVQQHVKDGDYLLPVSDMHIASAHWTREDEPAPPSLSSAADQIAQGKTKIETKQPQGSQQPQQTKYQYPISDQFKDLEDIFMAAWDDGYGIAAAKPMPAKASAKSGSSVTKGSHVDSQADPDEIPITWTRASTHAPGKPVSITAENDVVDDTVPIHWDRRSTITDELAGMILDHENRRDAETDGKVSSGSQESQKKRVEAVPTHSIECGEPEQSVYTDFIPEEPKVSPTRQRNEHVEGVGVIESAMSAAGGDGGATATATADATTTSELEADLLRKLEQKDEELSRQRRQLHDLQDRLDTLQESCYEQEDEAKRRSKAIRSRVGELEHHLALFTVWADEVHRRLGLESPSFLTQLTKLGKKKL